LHPPIRRAVLRNEVQTCVRSLVIPLQQGEGMAAAREPETTFPAAVVVVLACGAVVMRHYALSPYFPIGMILLLTGRGQLFGCCAYLPIVNMCNEAGGATVGCVPESTGLNPAQLLVATKGYIM
ncbi:MAG: hypothetical protein ACM3Q1_07835, partial [Bacteroidales bacterium]